MPPPTEKQLAFLKDLGYKGSAPTNVREASELISAMKSGVTSTAAEREMLFERAPPIEKARIYLAEVKERKRSGEEIAGWRLKVQRGAETEHNSIYNGAFLPFDVGLQYPELLAISGLEFDTELQRRPAKGPTVITPNQLSEITPVARKRPVSSQPPALPRTSQKRSGCLGVLLVMVVLITSLALMR